MTPHSVSPCAPLSASSKHNHKHATNEKRLAPTRKTRRFDLKVSYQRLVYIASD